MSSRAQVLISFDFGMKRIGVAIGQTLTKSARPLEVLPAKAGKPNWEVVKRLLQKWRPDALVVGIPLNMDGTDQPITRQAHEFAHTLRIQFGLPVHEIDERLTTKAAREMLFEQGGYKALQGGQVDCLAAQFILQNWFEENK